MFMTHFGLKTYSCTFSIWLQSVLYQILQLSFKIFVCVKLLLLDIIHACCVAHTVFHVKRDFGQMAQLKYLFVS